jgi:hypothetical protein
MFRWLKFAISLMGIISLLGALGCGPVIRDGGTQSPAATQAPGKTVSVDPNRLLHKAKEADVISELGEPNERGTGKDGNKFFRDRGPGQMVVINFNKEGVVSSVAIMDKGVFSNY